MLLSADLRALGAEIAAFLLAATCAGCGEPGALLCDRCREELEPRVSSTRTPNGLTVSSALSFDGVAARCIRRLKGEGETLLGRPLGAALAAVLRDPVVKGALAVPVPTSAASFRRRGYRVPELLIARAGFVPWRLLRTVGRRADQRGLGRVDRAANVRGGMRARRRGSGERVVLVDDVVTTGATLDEGVACLRDAGFEVVAAVALAATPRHSGLRGDPPETRRK